VKEGERRVRQGVPEWSSVVEAGHRIG